MITIQDTLLGRVPLHDDLWQKSLRIYACGVTPYDHCHLGHAKCYVSWDVMRRFLLSQEYKVSYVQNFTDLDDKIIARAQFEGCSPQAIADKYIQSYHSDMSKLNVLPADSYPKVTEHIPNIIKLIQELESLSYAYETNTGVYYRLEKFDNYGQMSNRTPQTDFCLWKSAKPLEPAWESPWGAGRPGWHIECSAMVQATLGTPVDVHCGGIDLKFPHHENEVAQSEPVYGKLAHRWLHNGFVTVKGGKMSKSQNNAVNLSQVMDEYGAMAVRMWLLQKGYRQGIVYTPEALQAAKSGWQRLSKMMQFDGLVPVSKKVELQSCLRDNFSTPIALALLFTWLRESKTNPSLRPAIRYGLELLGFQEGD